MGLDDLHQLDFVHNQQMVREIEQLRVRATTTDQQRKSWKVRALVAVSKLAKDEEPDCQLQLPTHANASSSAFAFFRSAVSKPSVNQP